MKINELPSSLTSNVKEKEGRGSGSGLGKTAGRCQRSKISIWGFNKWI